MSEPRLGISGRIAAIFLTSEITPLLALTALLLGVFAALVTPREEEPQINVTFANVFIPFPGASAREVEQMVTTPAEQVLSEIEGIEHIYSISRPGMSVLTVQFKVGEDRTAAIVRLYNKVFSNQDWFPPALGVGQPLIKPKGIDDVPIVTFTLWSKDPARGAYELSQVAHALEAELKRVPGTREVYTVGTPDQVVHVFLDAQKLAARGLSFEELRTALQAGNYSLERGGYVVENREIPVRAGDFLSSAEQVAELVVGLHGGKPVYLADVAEVRHRPYQPDLYVQHAEVRAGQGQRHPAVTLAVAKQPGTNAVTIARQVIQRFEQLRGVVIPDGVEATVTRNYGQTADDKARKLIQKLVFATASVVLLVLLTMGWREAIIVGTAVTITLALTLFASWAWGFTLNRVSLFALIFSIGILVDDAIVVVENIHRHIQLGAKNLLRAIPLAVDEVGGPTILATFTVVAALLPMAFVTGLMGPYMSPIPINASMGMLISLIIAFVVTPWLTYKLLHRRMHDQHPAQGEDGAALKRGFGYRLFAGLMHPFLRERKGALARFLLGIVLLALIGLSISLVANKFVVLKMLPFDNKSEVQVVIDMPEDSSLEQTTRVLDAAGDVISAIPEVENYQSYAGTTAPIGFNGLVRQYYLRGEAHHGDIQINLVDKHHRERKSHQVAREMRERLHPVAQRLDANIKVVEVPPGPPVFSPLVAEVYGIDPDGRIAAARELRTLFETTPDIIDIDDSIEHPARRLVLDVDRERAALFGISQRQVADAVATLVGGDDVTFLRDTRLKYAVPIRLEFSVADKSDLQNLLAFKIKGQSGNLVPISEIADVHFSARDTAIYHKDLLPVVYVTGDMAGDIDSPLYGMFEMYERIRDQGLPSGRTLQQTFIRQPANPVELSMKWDGEWQITYETFRDMGIAYAVGMLMIFLLVVGQFRSYLLPLIIMAPIPFTIIGVLPGHALLGAKFTATSMIGMIALAGIIVRNSILLVDFINQRVQQGMALEEAVVRAAAVRAKPILLTAIAATMGAFFILDDPIFNGLAVSLIFGILVSTLLTLLVIPVMYYAVRYRKGPLAAVGEQQETST
ncbi:MAG: efflux RND transporter permease subunit [Pseudomonadota bacterium]|nr:efflux RND transporter permease subunit [Pseudomonadota bacterium]